MFEVELRMCVGIVNQKKSMQNEVHIIRQVCLQLFEFIKTGLCAVNRKNIRYFNLHCMGMRIVACRCRLYQSSSAIDYYFHTFANVIIYNYKIDRQNSPLLVPRLKSIYNSKISSIRIITIHILSYSNNEYRSIHKSFFSCK